MSLLKELGGPYSVAVYKHHAPNGAPCVCGGELFVLCNLRHLRIALRAHSCDFVDRSSFLSEANDPRSNTK